MFSIIIFINLIFLLIFINISVIGLHSYDGLCHNIDRKSEFFAEVISYHHGHEGGGGLVGEKLVISSAEIFYGAWGFLMSVKDFYIIAGQQYIHDNSSNVQTSGLEKIIPHPNYTTDLNYNIAVLKLKKPLKKSTFVQFLKLVKEINTTLYPAMIMDGFDDVIQQFTNLRTFKLISEGFYFSDVLCNNLSIVSCRQSEVNIGAGNGFCYGLGDSGYPVGRNDTSGVLLYSVVSYVLPCERLTQSIITSACEKVWDFIQSAIK